MIRIQRRSQDFSLGTQVERQRRENRGAEGAEGGGMWGECLSPHWGWGLIRKLFEFFYITNKMVSCRSFWAAISYRLAACLPASEVHVELKFIGDLSSILGTIITPSGKLRAKK